MPTRLALVVDCGFGTLEASRTSARRMAEHLRARAFEVDALHDATYDDVRGAIDRAAARLGPGDAFVFYFVGHGDRGAPCCLTSDYRLRFTRFRIGFT